MSKKASAKPKKKAAKPSKASAKPKKKAARPSKVSAKPKKAAKAAPPTRHHDADVEPFAVTASDIEALNSLQLRRFIRDLLANEIDAYGGSASDLVDSPGDGTDDGEDFFTKRSLAIVGASDDFIPIGETVWQIKAEKQKPSEAKLKKEIAKLRPAAVLAAGGSYRFLAQQPGTKEHEVENTLKKVAAAQKRDKMRVAFFARGGLARRARQFPSLARLQFFNRPLERLHPYDWWNEKHRSPLFDDAV